MEHPVLIVLVIVLASAVLCMAADERPVPDAAAETVGRVERPRPGAR